MKIKSFECPKSIRNYEKKNILGTSDAWRTSRLPSKPAYYIVDYRILNVKEDFIKFCGLLKIC